MCFSENASWGSFSISFLVCIIIGIKLDNKYRWFAIAWFFAALMQIPEGITWRVINNKKGCTTIGKNAAKAAYILNILQPTAMAVFAIYIASIWGNDLDSPYMIFIYISMIIYLISVLTFTEMPTSCLKLTPTKHISLNYWGKYGFLHFIAFVIAIFALPKYKIVTLVIFVLSFIFSMIFYDSRSQPSIWCFTVVLAPLFMWAFIEGDKKNIIPNVLTK